MTKLHKIYEKTLPMYYTGGVFYDTMNLYFMYVVILYAMMY